MNIFPYSFVKDQRIILCIFRLHKDIHLKFFQDILNQTLLFLLFY